MKKQRIPQTLTEVLIERKNDKQKGITFITSGTNEVFLSYHELYTTALSLLGYLQDKGLRQGDELVFQIDDNKTFICFFWASILGGIIPVPVSVAHHSETAQKLFKIKNILNNAHLLIGRSNYEKFCKKEMVDENNANQNFDNVLFIEDSVNFSKEGIVQAATKDQIAFLQFSSGSTGNPKGVVLTHRNLLANTSSQISVRKYEGEDTFLGWMPLTHDMGLIGFHLAPIVEGINHFIMPTDLFIRHPLLWLQKVSEHRVTVTCSPNFGYKYYLNHFTDDKGKGLDLSCVRAIFNGAEPISTSLCRTFLNALSKFRLNPVAMRPVYGLAEATLQVTHTEIGTPFKSVFVERKALTIGHCVVRENMSDAADSLEVVNLGTTIPGMEIKITNEAGKTVKDGYVGIIWIRGESVTRRYYNNRAATNAVIKKDGWLNTGDTGFIVSGCLYVVGRVKDIIFINGANVYPHDVEQVAEMLDVIEVGKVVACGVKDAEAESECIVVFVMYKGSIEQFMPIVHEVKRIIASKSGLEVKHVIPVRKIFKTTSGKVKRHLFSEEYHKGTYAEVIQQMKQIDEKEKGKSGNVSHNKAMQVSPSSGVIREWLAKWLEQKLDLKKEDISNDATLAGLGMTSFQAIALVSDLENFLGIKIENTVVYNFPTINTLSNYLTEKVKEFGESSDNYVNERSKKGDDDLIAVIGMGCRFPGNSNTPEAFWKFLSSGESAIDIVPKDRWDVDAYYDKDEDLPGKMYTNRGGFIEQVDQFDPLFFGISPKEAACMDPQQRLLLEVCWEALEHAGLCPSKLRGSDSGIFIGIGTDDYHEIILNTSDNTYFNDAFSGLGVARSIAAGRIAYLLDFHGPVVQLDTACSSSLLSVHQACQNLILGECSLALAGGVSLMLSPETTVKLCKMKALSPSGLCKTFDDTADGYVRGEGAGIVVLKRLRDALKDGDTVLSVIKGSAVNHDGLSNGLTAPNGIAQQQLIEKTLSNADVKENSIQYVEVHGTGTRLGDPVEVQALNAIYGRNRSFDKPLLVGAVKTNIGHLEAAAGIAGFIKTVLCLQHQSIPGNLHYKEPNRFIPWSDMKLKVACTAMPWEVSEGEKRRAAVSAFGLSGTNVHIILEEAENHFDEVNENTSQSDYPSYPILLSAKSPQALKTLVQEYQALLENSSASLANIAYGAATTRDTFQHRIAFEASSKNNALERLQAYLNGTSKSDLFQGNVQEAKERIVWLFTGQGSQYWNMGRELYENNTVFRNVIDYCDSFLKQQWDISLTDLLYKKSKDEGNELLKQTAYTQPALFAIQCALAEVWKSWGVQPSIVAGHSVGEYAAAYVSGVFSLTDGLRLITERARLMHSIEEEGSMAVVFAAEAMVAEKIKPYGRKLAIAAVNAPALTVISGSKDAVAEVRTLLKQMDVASKELTVSHAFHSPLMEPILDEFEKIAKTITYCTPAISFVSNVTGGFVSSEITHPSYWRNHILEPVQFLKIINTINEGGGATLMEIGPQPTLLSMAQLTSPYNQDCLLPSMQQGQSSWSTMLQSLMCLHVKGVSVDWKEFFGKQTYQRVSLPLYPFARRRYWIDTAQKRQAITHQEIKILDKTPMEKDLTTTSQDVLGYLVDTFGSLLKMPANEINVHTRFLELGADSLVLAGAIRKIEKKYGLTFSIRLLFEEITTLDLMASYIAKRIPQAQPQEAIKSIDTTVPHSNGSNGHIGAYDSVTPNGILENLTVMQSQFNIMAQQFQLLSQQVGGEKVSANRAITLPLHSNGHNGNGHSKQKFSLTDVQQNGKSQLPVKKHQSIFPKMETQRGQSGFTPEQQEYLDAFIARYVKRTSTSKTLTQQYRSVLTDNRASAGFRFSTKEILYPILAASSEGSKIVDVDGNEYVDLAMGFGVNLLGHRPEMITRALAQQLQQGYQLGPQTPLAGQIATLIAEFTGMDRVSFHNSGTEAVMTAIRLARTVTGKNKIAIFAGSYHGHFDGTLAAAEDITTSHFGVPMAPGILQNMVNDILIFDYTNPDVVKEIQAHAHELAAVLVEPVQSRRPGYQPKELLHALRAMTAAEDVVLVFDEMITGFRIHPGGAQAYFGVQADLATYGKIVGGGLPIGVIAGRKKYMNALDGGMWQYGDNSYPQADVTFFAGTFCKHPLSMSSALALLKELKQRGPALQEQLNLRTSQLVKEISAFFVENQVPIGINNFGSLFYFSITSNMDLFFYHLVEKGVYIWEGRTCFLSAAHTDEDIDKIKKAIKDSVIELQQHGFIPRGQSGSLAAHTEVKNEGAVMPTTTIATSQHRPDQIPLSFSQERIWIVDQMEGSVAYNEPAIYKVNGTLNTTALTHALRSIVNRHEVLRTVICEDNGKPYQQINDKDLWTLDVVDGGLYSNDPASLEKYVTTLIHAPFDLSKDHMLRAHLINISEKESILVLVLHHIASDGWSADIILRELKELYEAFEQKRDAQLPPLTVQYADYSIWQRSYLKEEVLDKQVSYWKNKLTGVDPLNLPTDFTRPAIQSKRGDIINFNIDNALITDLKQLSKQQGVTLFMTLLSAFKVLLYRYSGQEDICVGTTIAGRMQEEVEDLVGFFVNTLALRSHLNTDMSFITLLQEVKQTTLEAFEHQDIPFEKVIDAVVKNRSLEMTPLFQVMFMLQNTPDVMAFSMDKVDLTPEPIELNTTKFDISFTVIESEEGCYANVKYCADLFKSETIARLCSHFDQLLRSIVSFPSKRISRLCILSESERLLVTEGFNATEVDYPTAKTIMDLLEEQVASNGNCIAVMHDGVKLTYDDLNKKSNQLAHYLKRQGVKPESLVALCVNRSIDMVISIIGILKAGGAYVPIDPQYPQERINYMLEDSNSNLVITDKFCSHLFAHTAKTRAICLHENRSRIGSEPTSNLTENISPNNLAYVIYTSGTTGNPKGVMIEHKSLAARMNFYKKFYSVSGKDRMLFYRSYSFDGTMEEYLLPLISGSVCVVASQDFHDDLRSNIFNYVEKYKITKINTPPVLLKNIVEFIAEQEIGKLASLRHVISGGDKLKADTVNLFHSKIASKIPVTLYNSYGPTENTNDSAIYKFDSNLVYDRVPIGRPLENSQIYILDKERQLLPIGIAGEICVGGKGISRGYLNRYELTAEKFVANAFRDSEKIYRTGDLGRWLPDGTVEFLDRLDNQVKIRGYRIELGEVEAALQQCEGVLQSVVVGKEDVSGYKRLVAYVVVDGKFDRDAILTTLKEKLPEYMVPSTLMELTSLPLNSNGKIDRKALPDPGASEFLTHQYIAPSTVVEVKLAQIWKELLGVEKVGIRDNFFELGGDSIITIQVVSRAKKEGLRLHPRNLFQYQTIAELASHVKEENIEIVSEEKLEGEVMLLPIQQRFFEQNYPERNHYNQSILLQIDKRITQDHVRDAFYALINQHDALRFSYQQEDGRWKQYVGSLQIEPIIHDLRAVSPGALVAEIEQLCDTYQRSLDITKGEVIRVAWMRTPDSSFYNRLLVVIHHLIVDGISWRILLEDLESTLDALTKKQPIQLGAKTTSLRQWGAALQEFADRENVKTQIPFWTSVTDAYLPLPVDKPGNPLVKDVRVHTVELPSSQTEALLKRVHQAYHTETNDILLSALLQTITDWAGTDQVVIGLEGHGRESLSKDTDFNSIDIGRTVGWFTSLYPVLLRTFNDEDGTGDLIKSVKEQLRHVPDKGLGYGVLRYLHPNEAVRRKLSSERSWDIVFNYLGQFDNVINKSRWFTMAEEQAGASEGAGNAFNTKLELNCMVLEGKLSFSWSYASSQYNSQTIEALAERYLLNLSQLIKHCLSQRECSYTPSDYGLDNRVTYRALDSFLAHKQNSLTRKEQINALYSLSPLQEGMLFHGLYESGAYVGQLICDLQNVDVKCFKASWNELLKNHTILRSGIYYSELPIPVQAVFNNLSMPFEELDFSALTPDEQSIQLDAYLASDKKRGFDLSHPPLIRITLIRLSDDQYKMIKTSHHILSDGWSLPIIMKEFLSNYDAFVQGRKPLSLPEDRYEDFVRYLQAQDKTQERNFWQGHLAGFETPSLLPFVNKTVQRNKGGKNYKKADLIFDTSVTAHIQKYAQRHHITVNTLMQGVWSYLLSKYTGTTDTVYGVTVAGRPTELPAAEQRVGLYINTIPIRITIPEDQTVTKWLARVQDSHSSAREFQYTSLSDIQQWQSLPGDFFDTLMVFENYPIGDILTDNWMLKLQNVQVEENANYLLTVIVGLAQELTITFNYNADLLQDNYADMIRGHFEHVLKQIIHVPEIKISEIDMLAGPEKDQLLLTFNNTQALYPKGKTVIDIFEEQVRKTPDQVAVVFEENSLTYQQLNDKSNQIAHYLRSNYQIVGDDLVGLLAERSERMIIGILGILKSGAGYVPIDPAYPRERIQYMLLDSNPKVLLTDVGDDLLRDLDTKDSVSLKHILEISKGQSVVNLEAVNNSKSIAYIMYTSGSTGKPKGVVIEHESIVVLVKNTNYTNIQPDDHVMQLSNYGFDGSTFDIFGSLLNGASLYCISKEELLSPDGLVNFIERNEINIGFMTTSLFNNLVELNADCISQFDKIYFGGETASVKAVKTAMKKRKNRESLVNVYGPTEATTFSTTYSVEDIDQISTFVPIGSPISNTTIYILNTKLVPVPIGVIGEIYIGGPGVARGYLNQPDLTNEKFIPNPFEPGVNNRLYKTGDLGKWLPDGTIEFVARRDGQVKIRGFRIELDEIEIVLQECAGVRQCVVLVKEDSHDNKQLVGYVVSDDNFDKQTTQQTLRAKLPDYMVPTLLIVLPEMPLTSNGKIDKKLLSNMDLSGQLNNDYVGPRNETEEKLVALWQELLNIERVGIYDNFFELGGHSLLVVRVVVAIRHEFALNLPVNALFMFSSIAALAEYIDATVVSACEKEEYEVFEL